MASTTSESSSSGEGSVLRVLSNRIRDLREKLKRINDIEKNPKKTKTKEQEELLLSKPSLEIEIDALEKLRIPLIEAIEEENQKTINKQNEEIENIMIKNQEQQDLLVSKLNEQNKEQIGQVVEDLLKVMYVGTLFNIKIDDKMLENRSHERNMFLCAGFVDDDEDDYLDDADLDSLTEMSDLLVSQPEGSSFSHEAALRRCVDHARNWIAKSQDRIHDNSTVTYAALREKLAKIIGSLYYKLKPAVKVHAKAAAEKKGETEAENSSATPVDQVKVQVGGTDNKDQSVPRQTHQNQKSQNKKSPNQKSPNQKSHASGGAEVLQS